MRIQLPESLRDSATGTPAALRDAATVILLRDGATGLQTYLLRRQATMEFAAGAYVFPGGAVHPGDSDPLTWFGPSPQWWGDRFDCAPELASALVVAAARETFEESGILLAGPDADTVVSDVDSPEYVAARAALDQGELSFADFLAEHQLGFRADLMAPWAHWVTPKFESRRYDTRFLVARVPHGQQVGGLPGEADRAEWATVGDVLAAHRAKKVMLLPPTIHACREIADYSTDEILAQAQRKNVVKFEPRVIEDDGILYLEYPEGAV